MFYSHGDIRKFLQAFALDVGARMSGGASVVLAILGAISSSLVPNWVFWVFAGLCYLFASYRIWIKEHRRANCLQNKLDKIRAARPDIKIHDMKCLIGWDTKLATYYCAQVSFRNEPRTHEEQSVARRVTATIGIDSQASKQWPTKWVSELSGPPIRESIARYNPQWHTTAEQVIDIIPNGAPRTVVLVFKHGGEEEAYLCATTDAFESLEERDERRRILPGTHNVKVTLKGIGVEREFLFRVMNIVKGELKIEENIQ